MAVEKGFGTHLGDLGQGPEATEAGHILPCPHGRVRTAHPKLLQN